MCIYIYIYIRGSSAYKYTTQRIHSIQKCLIQYVYTKKFIIQYVWKESTHQASKKHNSCLAQRKATRTTQPEEGKRESDE